MSCFPDSAGGLEIPLLLSFKKVSVTLYTRKTERVYGILVSKNMNRIRKKRMMKMNITTSQLMITRKKSTVKCCNRKKNRKPSIIFESFGSQISE